MRNTARSRTMALMVLALGAGFGAATAATNGACTQTSQYVQKACQAGAQSDYQTSLGKCKPDVLEDKLYAPGVGNILTVDVNTGERSALVRIVHP